MTMIQSIKENYLDLGTESRWAESFHLRFAVACCFIGHGILAYQASTNFGSEWNAWVRMLFPESLQYSGASTFLQTVAFIDILDGLLLLMPRIPRSALTWVFVWGGMTALSRLFFLGAHVQPLEVNTLNAFAEFFKRAPNWIIPLLLIANVSPKIEARFQILKNKFNWLNAAVGSQMIGIYLKNCHSVSSPFFHFELMKVNMPLWFFWCVTVGSFLGIVLTLTAAKLPKIFYKLRFLSFIVPITYLCSECFFIYSRNFPGGFEFTFTRLISHFSMYLSVTLWTLEQAQGLSNSSIAKLRSSTT